MNTPEQEAARLETLIAEQEAEVAQLEAELSELRQELAEFEERFNKTVKPVVDMVDAAKAAVAAMERQHRQDQLGFERPAEPIWRTSSSASDTGFSTDQSTSSSSFAPPTQSAKVEPPLPLKKLYRQLARRYHPDFAIDEADRERRNEMMQMINEAYEKQDMDALNALHEASPAQVQDQPTDAIPLAVLKLRKLREKYFDLRERLSDLRMERSNLLHSDMMDLKIQEKLARLKGGDLLQEIRAGLDKEYWELMQRLDELRNAAE